VTRLPPAPWPRAAAVGVLLAASAFGIIATRPAAAGQSAPPGGLVIDHRSVAEFERLDDRQIQDASRRHLVLRSASIGWNIDQGLDCLMNRFADRRRRPNFCDRRIPPGEVVYDAKYDRRNWAVEVRGNPGWYGKVADFVDRLDRGKPGESLDVVAFNFNYSDGVPTSDILDRFFGATTGGKAANVAALEALEKRHPDKTFVWWTMALPRQSSTTMQRFNERLRAYALERNKILFDLADIESHRPDGGACLDNQGAGLEAICQEYTDERDSGHLNARGAQRGAKAIWVLMATLAERTR
jgi:hypothetical protein